MSEPIPEPELRVRDHAGGWRPVRELDPAEAPCRRDVRLAPTRYVADRLIVRGTVGEGDEVLALLREQSEARGLVLVEEELDLAPMRREVPRRGIAVHLTQPDGDAADVWDLLDDLADRADIETSRRIGLDHVLTGHRPKPGLAVLGDREPSHQVGPAPVRALGAGSAPWLSDDGVSRPVVAVVDTGIGTHPWFNGSHVIIRDAEVDGRPIGTFTEDEPVTGHEPETELPPYLGHGTFIAGVVHQVCADAAILPVRVMSTDGSVREWDLARSLERLLEYHLRGVAGIDGYAPVDVVVLALGFHPELLEDDDYEGVLRGVLRDLRREGVIVVVSAGNDGREQPVFPAAWAPHVRRVENRAEPLDDNDLRADYTPLLVVTAANPNGTLASFANDGPWVTAVRPGTNVHSTMPTTADGALLPTNLGDGGRESVDPDDFTGGFATWSGTSFAAPVLAGELAKALVSERIAGPSGERVAAAWRAVANATGLPIPV
ncbi:S8 family serine peptidase [Promicromonospora sp. NPDC059942]|uniref:S8 family peptidase n=1 Tax=Promicromonospora sp. NPDC059942 TaxID=3347009 RepID=UPI0036469A86